MKLRNISLAIFVIANFAGPFVSAAAPQCPDISGLYKVADNTVMKLEQVECLSLTKSYGTIESNGSITYNSHAFEYSLNGTPLCDRRHRCQQAFRMSDGIDFRANYVGTLTTSDHGDCSEHTYTLSKDSLGNLISTFSVFDCGDGFKGKSVLNFAKY